MRTAEIKRKTGETEIFVKLNVDGTGVSKIDTGCPFLDHMLTLFSKHSRMDIEIKAKGDVEVDYQDYDAKGLLPDNLLPKHFHQRHFSFLQMSYPQCFLSPT